jgi:rhodanese-related sulfurtransferase
MQLIGCEELNSKLERGDEFKLVMALPALPHRNKRIPGSIQFGTIQEALAVLDPDDDVVVYCADVFCPASIYVAALLERRGFSRVRRYAGGVAEWEAAGLPLEGDGAPAPRAERARRRWRPSARPRLRAVPAMCRS